MKNNILCFLFILFSLNSTSAQTPKELIDLSIDKQGDWRSVLSFSFRTSRSNADRWQGYDYNQLVFQKDTYQLKYDIPSGNFENHTVNHYPGGYVFDTYRTGLDSVYWVYDGLRSRTGNDLINLGKSLYDRKSADFLLSFPYYILKEAGHNNNLSLDSTALFFVLRSSDREYWLNKSNLLLEKYITIRNGVKNVQTFKNYIKTQDVQIPRISSFLINEEVVFLDTLKDFKFNRGRDALTIKLPENYVKTTEYDGPPILKKLSANTYIIEKIDSDRNIIFRDMGNYIVVTEAPVSRETVKKIIEQISLLFPNKPIRYVHLSHFHKDHIAGIAEFIANGTSVICTPETSGPVIDWFRQSYTGDIKKHVPKIVYIREKLQIGTGDNCIRFYAINNSHAKGMSFAYLPKEQMIYQGDLLSLPDDQTLTAPIEINEQFFRKINTLKLKFKLIVGHHGLPYITAAMIKQMKNMRSPGHIYRAK